LKEIRGTLLSRSIYHAMWLLSSSRFAGRFAAAASDRGLIDRTEILTLLAVSLGTRSSSFLFVNPDWAVSPTGRRIGACHLSGNPVNDPITCTRIPDTRPVWFFVLAIRAKIWPTIVLPSFRNTRKTKIPFEGRSPFRMPARLSLGHEHGKC